MDDVPWLYVAMIFIAFVSWVWNRIQEASAARRERIAAKRAAERSRRTTEAPEWESPYQDQWEPEEATAYEASETETPKTFRDVFQDLQQQLEEAASDSRAPATQQPTPPPLPASARSAPQNVETELESFVVSTSSPIASGAIEASAIGATRRKNFQRTHETSQALAGVLRNRRSLRTALILKEVLDRPKALRRSSVC